MYPPWKPTAKLSDDGMYRYTLTRRWRRGPCAVWIMLNPSTADATMDDPTIRRCLGFSDSWGAGSLIVVNLFAYRATQPRELFTAEDPIGPENDDVIRIAMDYGHMTIAAWGAHSFAHRRAAKLLSGFHGSTKLHTLGLTNHGAPRHPLYVKANTEPEEWAQIDWRKP